MITCAAARPRGLAPRRALLSAVRAGRREPALREASYEAMRALRCRAMMTRGSMPVLYSGWAAVRQRPGRTRPVSYASTTAATRSRTLAFPRMFETWVFAVASVMNSRPAISAFDRPCPISVGERLGLRRRDVDFDARKIRVVSPYVRA